MTAGVSRLSFLELKNPAYCKYTKYVQREGRKNNENNRLKKP